MSGLKTCDHDLLYPATVRPSCTAVNQIHEFECQDSTQEMQTMTEVIQIFQDNIKCGPEYECISCDQLWYCLSVRKCEANKYPKCSKTLLDACTITIASIDNTKWI